MTTSHSKPGYSTVGSVLDLSIKILVALCPIKYWADWITYILKGLQCKIDPVVDRDDYLKLLFALRQAITERLENGSW